MHIKWNKRIIVLLAVCAVVVAAAALLVSTHANSGRPRTLEEAGLTKVPGFRQDGACAAVSPACGVCYGNVIDGNCYVVKSTLTPEQAKDMGL